MVCWVSREIVRETVTYSGQSTGVDTAAISSLEAQLATVQLGLKNSATCLKGKWETCKKH